MSLQLPSKHRKSTILHVFYNITRLKLHESKNQKRLYTMHICHKNTLYLSESVHGHYPHLTDREMGWSRTGWMWGIVITVGGWLLHRQKEDHQVTTEQSCLKTTQNWKISLIYCAIVCCYYCSSRPRLC